MHFIIPQKFKLARIILSSTYSVKERIGENNCKC